MAAQVLTFSQAFDKASSYSKRHLLLGNGFSIACEPKIFTYGSLFDQAKKDMTAEILEVFERLQTTDFEVVMRALQQASAVVSIYGAKPGVAVRIADDARQLQHALIKAVAGRHPERPNHISDDKYAYCRNFLSLFIGGRRGGKIYTLNYDLLLYWALMHEPIFGDDLQLDHDDGFRKDPDDLDAEYVIWHGETYAHMQNVHYVHGAMHLFDAGAELQKYTWVNTGKALVEQANEAMNGGLFPVFVAEGASHQKLAKIKHSAYLHHNFKSLCSACAQGAKSALFVFGHSLADNDRHIFDRIGRSQLGHLFVSLFGPPTSDVNKAIRANADRIVRLRGDHKMPLRLDFFQAETAEVWG
jgi:hypothetical protein